MAPTRQEAEHLRALKPFTGRWLWHGQSVAVDEDGFATVSWRVYRWCHDDATPPCDRFAANLIIPAGAAVFVLTRVQDTTADGFVLTSSDETVLPVGALQVELRPGDHLLVPGLGDGPLCGPHAEPWNCGA